jgi:hypothetical protein
VAFLGQGMGVGVTRVFSLGSPRLFFRNFSQNYQKMS